ncbi:MAG: hypothetical protein MUF81_06560 [Verrucomicrobia bacterium]|nr:hypothetical protein [Verrucomicrobiota bacterium]
MNARPAPRRPPRGGYALLLALVFVGVSLLLLTSLLQWTSGNALVTDRNNAYNRAVAAAEAATEKVLSQMTHDFINQKFDPTKLDDYRSLIPTNDWAAEYEFSNGAGAANQTWVESTLIALPTYLDSQFAGLYGSNYLCTVRANAQFLTPAYPSLAAAVRQDFQLASIPIFQFAIYYAMDLEINPSRAMTITGKVRGNADLYASPGTALKFEDAVGAVGKIYHHRHPSDPNTSSGLLPVYDSLHQEKVSSLTLPIGTNNSPANVCKILLDPPPAGESLVSTLGKQRYYNKAELLILVSDTNVTVQVRKPGGFDASPAPVSWTNAEVFISTNKGFFDQRETNYMKTTEIDVANLRTWAATDATITSKLGSGNPPNLIYVADNRATTSTTSTAVRVVNGTDLNARGLTVVTPQPLYVKGNFNESDPKPASLVGDSITILSNGWEDDESNKPLANRKAMDTTVNAALLAGIVQTTNSGGVKHYSGGVENFPRFLEDWGGRTLTYNGSLVVMFPSRYATNFWVSDYDGNAYYKRPTRKWAFDVNFLNWNKLPPGTPQVQKLVRGRWSVVAATSPN